MQALRLAIRIVALASLLVPRAQRSEWRREWVAELTSAAPGASPTRLLRRSVLAFADAWTLPARIAPRRSATRRPVGALDSIGADVRFAVRTLRRSAGFTTIALLTLALGIGINATVFGAVDAVLFRPLPFADADRLVAVEVVPGASVSKSTLSALRTRTRVFEGLAGWSRWGFTWTGAGPARVLTGARMTADLFTILGATPAVGRLLQPGDDAPGAAPVAVASYRFWRSELGAEVAAVGRTLQLDGVAHTLVGVTESEFAFPDAGADLYLPTTLDPADESDWTAGYLLVLGRLRPGPGADVARDDVRAAMAALADEGATDAADFGAAAVVEPLRDALVGAARAPLIALLAAVGFVLLVACANLANLMLARTTGRTSELAVRKALGASSGRVARQLLLEGAALSVAGVMVGLALARVGVVIAEALLPPTLPGAEAVRVDGRVVLATIVAAMTAALLASLFPTLRAARAAPSAALGERSGTGGKALLRAQAVLLTCEVALAVLLVASAGLALQTVSALRATDTGYRPEDVMTMMAVPPSARYADGAALRIWWDEALAALRSIPGVVAAGGIHLAPFGGGDWNPELVVENRPLEPDEQRPEVGWRVVTPGWFETAGIPLVAGRDFDRRDRADSAGVAIVNETLARRFWPDGGALGRRVRTFFEDGQWVEIVGVVGDTRDVALHRDVRPQMYRPHSQFPPGAMMLAARSNGPAPVSAAAMRAALVSVDDDVPILDPGSLAERIGASIAREQLVARLLGTFSALALLLGAVGIYGVAAHAVGRRRRELGVRSALGASGADLLRLVLGQTARLAAAGAVIGLGLAIIGARLAAARIANLATPGPALPAISATVLFAVAMLAAWIPARRAARTDPQRTLRED